MFFSEDKIISKVDSAEEPAALAAGGDRRDAGLAFRLERTFNIQHRTSNVEVKTLPSDAHLPALFSAAGGSACGMTLSFSSFDVGCWTFKSVSLPYGYIFGVASTELVPLSAGVAPTFFFFNCER